MSATQEILDKLQAMPLNKACKALRMLAEAEMERRDANAERPPATGWTPQLPHELIEWHLRMAYRLGELQGGRDVASLYDPDLEFTGEIPMEMEVEIT